MEKLLLSKLAYDCIKYAMNVPSGSDFLYSAFLSGTYDDNSDYQTQANAVWDNLNEAFGQLLVSRKLRTFTKSLSFVSGTDYVVLPDDIGEVLNAVDIHKNGLYFNLDFRTTLETNDDGDVENRLYVLGGIHGDAVTIEYFRAIPRFDRESLVALTSDLADNNVNLAEYGLTYSGYQFMKEYIKAMALEILDPSMKDVKLNKALNDLMKMPSEVKFSQDRVSCNESFGAF